MDISSMLEVQVKEETDVKENGKHGIKERATVTLSSQHPGDKMIQERSRMMFPNTVLVCSHGFSVTPGKDQASSATSTATATISQDESNFYKLMFGNDIAAVRFRRIHCTACDAHIGSAPAQIHNMFEHPVLRTLLCANCRDFYGDGTFEQGDDATDMFCRWCANGGNLYCCSYCSNTFCYKCIRRNFSSLVRKKIEADEKWKCFVCNPSGLYSARAVCWALLQHVQTVTRILAHDKKMTAHEIEEKMNLDESPCCPRRNKRKRRRLESNSEEEDETYSPVKANGMSQPGQIKRKQLKKHKPTVQPAYSNTTNGTREVRPFIMPIPIRPRPASFLSGQSFKQPEPSQSVVSHKNVLVSPSNIVLPSSSVIKSNTSLPSRFDPETLQQQPSLYHTSFMNTSGSTAYIQTPVTMNPTRIILPSHPQSQLTSYQPQQTSSYQSSQPLQSSPNTMVSIPNSVDKRGRSLFLLPKSKESGVTLTPNIIELDSDSDDELKIVEQQNAIDEGNNLDVNAFSNKVVPVALTWENSDDDCMREEQPLKETLATFGKDISFSEMMLPHSQELDKLFSDAKVKVYDFFDLNNAIENIEVEAQQRLKHFYCNMRDTVFQLVDINDRITRQYVEWRRSRKVETEASSSINENALVSQENITIPLDMTCVNDSDTEDKDEGYRIMEPSDLIKDSNIVKDLLFYKKKNVVHRDVGDDSVHLSVDKAIQVYDIISKDYEESIGYFVCTKTDHDPKMNYSVSDNLPATLNKNSSKYEDQFIFYLQNIENNDTLTQNIDTEDTKSSVDSDETPLQKVIQTDISCLIQDIDLPIVSTDQSKNCQEEKDLSDNINSVTKNDTLNKINKEIVSNSDSKIQETNIELDKLQETESWKTHTDTMNEKAILIMSDNNEVNSSKNGNIINTEVAASTGTEEDCTIIDD